MLSRQNLPSCVGALPQELRAAGWAIDFGVKTLVCLLQLPSGLIAR